jgi:threonine dehydrogenase-like Zn-dependent dehydrogenase
MYLKGISYEVGRVHACATARPVLDLVKAGALDPARIINKVVPFSEAVDGMLLPVPKVVFINDFT